MALFGACTLGDQATPSASSGVSTRLPGSEKASGFYADEATRIATDVSRSGNQAGTGVSTRLPGSEKASGFYADEATRLATDVSRSGNQAGNFDASNAARQRQNDLDQAARQRQDDLNRAARQRQDDLDRLAGQQRQMENQRQQENARNDFRAFQNQGAADFQNQRSAFATTERNLSRR